MWTSGSRTHILPGTADISHIGDCYKDSARTEFVVEAGLAAHLDAGANHGPSAMSSAVKPWRSRLLT
jgi:hypothetical protein